MNYCVGVHTLLGLFLGYREAGLSGAFACLFLYVFAAFTLSVFFDPRSYFRFGEQIVETKRGVVWTPIIWAVGTFIVLLITDRLGLMPAPPTPPWMYPIAIVGLGTLPATLVLRWNLNAGRV